MLLKVIIKIFMSAQTLERFTVPVSLCAIDVKSFSSLTLKSLEKIIKAELFRRTYSSLLNLHIIYGGGTLFHKYTAKIVLNQLL